MLTGRAFEGGLIDRSSRPHRRPQRIPVQVELRIVRSRLDEYAEPAAPSGSVVRVTDRDPDPAASVETEMSTRVQVVLPATPGEHCTSTEPR